MVSALLPLLLSSAYLGDTDRSSNFVGPVLGDFGFPEIDLYLPPTHYRYSRLTELLRSQALAACGESVTLDKDAFKVVLNLEHFKPEEIEVKVVGRQVLVTANHEENKEGESALTQQVKRSYVVPENVVLEEVSSSLSSDGVLTVQAPVKELPEPKAEEPRPVKVELTGKPAATSQSNQEPEQSPKENTEEAPKESPKESAKENSGQVDSTTAQVPQQDAH